MSRAPADVFSSQQIATAPANIGSISAIGSDQGWLCTSAWMSASLAVARQLGNRRQRPGPLGGEKYRGAVLSGQKIAPGFLWLGFCKGGARHAAQECGTTACAAAEEGWTMQTLGSVSDRNPGDRSTAPPHFPFASSASDLFSRADVLCRPAPVPQSRGIATLQRRSSIPIAPSGQRTTLDDLAATRARVERGRS